MFATIFGNFDPFAPIFASLIIAAGGVAGYIYQSRQNLKAHKLAAKQAQYEKILSNVFKLLYAETGIEYADTLIELEKSWLYASDEVLVRCYDMIDFHVKISGDKKSVDTLNNDNNLVNEFNKILRSLLIVMRKDLGFSPEKNVKSWPVDRAGLYRKGIMSYKCS